jgi:hypothetical protein
MPGAAVCRHLRCNPVAAGGHVRVLPQCARRLALLVRRILPCDLDLRASLQPPAEALCAGALDRWRFFALKAPALPAGVRWLLVYSVSASRLSSIGVNVQRTSSSLQRGFPAAQSA